MTKAQIEKRIAELETEIPTIECGDPIYPERMDELRSLKKQLQGL